MGAVAPCRTTISKDSSRRKYTCWALPSVRGSESCRSKRRKMASQRSLAGPLTAVGMPTRSTEQSTVWSVPNKMHCPRRSQARVGKDMPTA